MGNQPPQIKPILGNRYQLHETIGTGGMAVVYNAWDSMLERQVAIKLLKHRYSRDARFREQFHLEAKAAANLSHQNIVTVHDFGLDKDRLYIVMEYIPGQDLKSIIKKQNRFSTSNAILLISQACFGIGYAHRSGLVHCDVKPHNMLVYSNQRLKVTDFGIARLMASIQPDEQHEIVWGSPLYFSPEQASGDAPSPASDVYSLGIILYEMLTGQVPFLSNDPSELARMHREDAPIPPGQFNPEIHPTLEQIILKVLSKKPADRYNNADQLGRILLTFHRQSDTMENEQYSQINQKNPNNQIEPENHNRRQPEKESISENDLSHSSAISAIDWPTIGIGLLTLIMVGGLIPFWLYIWLSLRMP